ncbi:MAG: DUF3524 domain-containing protein, partial [Pseudohongiella sp.]
YFHENQFAYPPAPGAHGAHRVNLLNAQIINVYTALCADRIAFNSEWNQQSFFDGLSALLKKLPDQVPNGLPTQLQKKSCVLAVPLPDHLFTDDSGDNSDTRRPDQPHTALQIVWNHRHEYDKGPALLLAIVQQLIRLDLPFRLHLLGQRFRHEPAEFARLRALLTAHYQRHRLEPGMDDWLPSRAAYEAVLTQSDIVLSTALHDFQGLSILEAVARGCVPLTPAALAYPEYIDPVCLYAVAGLSQEQQAMTACEKIITWHQAWQQPGARRPIPDVSQFRATAMHKPWSALFDALFAATPAD